MSTAFTPVHLDTFRDDVIIAQYAALLNGESGVPIENPGCNDRSVQIEGTLGVGGTVVIEGSNDGTGWVTLTDPQGNLLSFTAVNKLEQIEEITRYVRARVTAGDGTTSFRITFCLRRNA